MRGNLDLILRAREAEAQRDRLAKALRDLDKLGADSGDYAKGSPLYHAWREARTALAEYDKESGQ